MYTGEIAPFKENISKCFSGNLGRAVHCHFGAVFPYLPEDHSVNLPFTGYKKKKNILGFGNRWATQI